MLSLLKNNGSHISYSFSKVNKVIKVTGNIQDKVLPVIFMA